MGIKIKRRRLRIIWRTDESSQSFTTPAKSHTTQPVTGKRWIVRLNRLERINVFMLPHMLEERAQLIFCHSMYWRVSKLTCCLLYFCFAELRPDRRYRTLIETQRDTDTELCIFLHLNTEKPDTLFHTYFPSQPVRPHNQIINSWCWWCDMKTGYELRW